MEEIWSTDGGQISLWRRGKVFRIGRLQESFVMCPEGHLKPGFCLTWEFYEDHERDVVLFTEEGGFLTASLSPARPDYLVRTFAELVGKKAKLNVWVNVIRSEFIVTELGFA